MNLKEPSYVPIKHLWHCFRALIGLDKIALSHDQITGLSAVDKEKQGQTQLCIFSLYLFSKGLLMIVVFSSRQLKHVTAMFQW